MGHCNESWLQCIDFCMCLLFLFCEVFLFSSFIMLCILFPPFLYLVRYSNHLTVIRNSSTIIKWCPCKVWCHVTVVTYDGVAGVQAAVIRWTLHGHNIPQSHARHLQPPASFPIDFPYWKLAMKVTNVLMWPQEAATITIASQLPNAWTAILWPQTHCDGHNYKDLFLSPSCSTPF